MQQIGTSPWCDRLYLIASKGTESELGTDNLKRNYCYLVEILVEIYLLILPS